MKRPLGTLPILAMALASATAGCIDDEPSPISGPDFSVMAGEAGPPAEISVYTQNMWLGGDTGPLFSLDFNDLPAVAQAAGAFYGQVLDSDIPSRAAAFADELEANSPRVVALQEATAYQTGVLIPGPEGLNFIGTDDGPNLVVSLLQEIAIRDLPYSIAEILPTSAIALPTNLPTQQGIPALGVQDHLAILVHDDVEVESTDMGHYSVNVAVGPLEVTRGWVSATVEQDDETYHFVVTHLETQGSPAPGDPIRAVHNAQAAELAGVLSALEGNVVLMGDLNSDALADPSERSWTPTYDNLVDAGFIDVWGEAPPAGRGDGATCCLAPDRDLEERIDFVMVRHADSGDRDEGRHRGFYRSDVVNTAPIAEGLWPSDHAGLFATIAQPGVMR